MKHHRETTRECPAELQHGDIKRKTGHGKPARIAFVRHASSHAGKKIHHVSVRDHHALGFACRARGVNHIGSAVCGRCGQRGRNVWRAPPRRIHEKRLSRSKFEPHRKCRTGYDQRRSGVLNHESHPVCRIVRIQRQIRGTCLLNGQQSDDEIGRAIKQQPHHIPRLHAPGDQALRNSVGLVIDLPVRKITPAKTHCCVVWGSRCLSRYGFMHALICSKRNRCGIEGIDHFNFAGRHQGNIRHQAVCRFKSCQIERQLPGHRLDGF